MLSLFSAFLLAVSLTGAVLGVQPRGNITGFFNGSDLFTYVSVRGLLHTQSRVCSSLLSKPEGIKRGLKADHCVKHKAS